MERNQTILKKYKKNHPICEKCKQQKSTQVHHILEIVNGGKDNEDNLLAVCDDCHKAIHKLNHGELTSKGIRNPKNPSRNKYAYKIKLLNYINDRIDFDMTATDIIDLIVEF